MALPTASDNQFPKVILEEVLDDGSATVTPAADHRALFVGEDGDLHLKDSAGVVTDFPAGGADSAALVLEEVLDDGSATTTPAADFRALFVGEDGDLHLKDSAGVVTDFPAGGSAGAPTDAEYLVTAAHASLSVEKVVVAPATLGVVPAIVHKAADETVSASTTLQNDDELLFAMVDPASYKFEVDIFYSSSTAADIKFAITVPASAALRLYHSSGLDAVGGSNNEETLITASGSACGSHSGQGVGTVRHVRLGGYARTNGTAGNLQLQWAQVASDATNTVVHLGSTLTVWKIA